MNVSVENLSNLERRVNVSLPITQIESEVDQRLKKLARTVKLHGFRPGKVPFRLVAQQYGPQVRSEVIGDALQKRFSDAIKEQNLKVAGNQRIEPVQKESAENATAFEFSATFEIYPEVKTGDVSAVTVERPSVTVTDAEVDKTIEILRKQRTTFAAAEGRAAQKGDKLTIDFEGKIEGEVFAGGTAKGFAFTLGEGRMLPEFEAAAEGLAAGQAKTFDLKFPDDYHGKDVAGKTASFTLTVNLVEAPSLPTIDAEFAKGLGVEDGDVAKMRADIKANVEREVAKRIKARTKSQALQALHDSYKAKGFTVVGVPSGDFGGQEYGSNAEVKQFCESKVGIKFTMAEKAVVKGPKAIPLYKWAANTLGEDKTPQWNFHKYLIGKDGRLIAAFGTKTTPTSPEVTAAVAKALATGN